MGWYSDKAGQAGHSEELLQRFSIAISRYERLIEHFATQHVIPGRIDTDDLYQIGVLELWDALVEDSDKLDPRDPNFERWYKTRLGHSLIDEVAKHKPRRGPKRTVEHKPFAVKVRRRRTGVDVIPVEAVSRIMNIRQDEQDYAEGVHFEFVVDPVPGIRWLAQLEQPSAGSWYTVEGVQVLVTWVAPTAGMRDPRLEVPDTLWEHFGPRKAASTHELCEFQLTPEERFLKSENQRLCDILMERLTVQISAEEKLLLEALAADTLNQGKGTVETRLRKMLNWTAKDLAQTRAKLTGSVQRVVASMRSEGLEVSEIARNFYLASGGSAA